MTIINTTDRELQLQAEVAELDEKLEYMTLAFSEWIEKTQWVQDTIQPGELGMHRADVIKSRFDELQAKLAEVSRIFSTPVGYQYKYGDYWRFSNGEQINGSYPTKARSVYVMEDEA